MATDGEFWVWKPFVGNLGASLPRCPVSLAAASKRSQPQTAHAISERHERLHIRRHGVIGEEAHNDLPEPLSLFGDGQVPPSIQLLFGLSEFRSHAVASGFPLEEEFAPP